MMKAKGSAASALALLLMICICLSGCSGGTIISEDMYIYDLPAIDPDDGVEKQVKATLYYRLNNEAYLVGVEETIPVLPGEQAETAVIRALLTGGALPEGDVNAPFNGRVSVLDVAYEGNILYVTLSDEMLEDFPADQIDRSDYDSEESYLRDFTEAEEETYLARRLGALSIVNTITGSSTVNNLTVQLLVDTDGDGEGEPPACQELGFDGEDGELMEPLPFDREIVGTTAKVANCLMEHLRKGEYEWAYALLAEDGDKPQYDAFLAQMEAFGQMDSYYLAEPRMHQGRLIAAASVEYAVPGGDADRAEGTLYFYGDGNLQKVDYDSLVALLEG